MNAPAAHLEAARNSLGRRATALPVAVFDAPLVAPQTLLRALRRRNAVMVAPPDGPALVGVGAAVWSDPRVPGALVQALGRAPAATHPGEALRAFVALPYPDDRVADGVGRGVALIPRWQYWSDGRSARLLWVGEDGPHDAPKMLLHRLGRLVSPPARAPGAVHLIDADTDFRARVDEACVALDRGDFSKVVLARRVRYVSERRLDALSILENLALRAGGSARLAIVRGDELFVAATPERLVRRVGDAVTCEALAGTADLAAPDGSKAVSSAKNAREHLVVVEHIAAALAPLCRTLDWPTTPSTRRLGHLAHLSTPISGLLRSPVHILDLVRRLNPTPAVGAAPGSAAGDFIRRVEPSVRGLYAGVVGHFDARGDGDFWVGLRGARFHGRQIEQFVGAGIVQGSESDAEWQETEAKRRGLAAALGLVP